MEEALIEMYLDGVFLKRNWSGEIVNISVLIAIGVNEDSYREVLGAAGRGQGVLAVVPCAFEGARP